MKKALIGAILLAGCGGVETGSVLSVHKEPDQVCAATKDVQTMYAVLRTVVSRQIKAEEAACDAGKITKARCSELRAGHKLMREADLEANIKIMNPKAVLDTGKIITILKAIGAGVGALTEAPGGAVALRPPF